MIVVLILALVLAVVVALWAWQRAAQAKKQAADAKAAMAKLERQVAREREAYRSEAERLEKIHTGDPARDFRSSVNILRELGRHPKE